MTAPDTGFSLGRAPKISHQSLKYLYVKDTGISLQRNLLLITVTLWQDLIHVWPRF